MRIPKLAPFKQMADLKPMKVADLKPIDTGSVSKRQSLKEWHAAGGGVPVGYEGREHVWHKKVQRFADAGKVEKDPLDKFSPPRYRSAGRRPESQQDREAAANMPLDLARGVASGVLGAPGDIESFVRMLPGFNEKTFLPTSEEIEKRIPLRSDTPAGRAATGLGTLAGGLYTGPGAPIRLVPGIPQAVYKAGKDFVQAAGQTGSNVIKRTGEGIQNILPAAKRNANKANFLEPSAEKRRMYHGTKSDVQSFYPGRKGSFVSPDPEFASDFAETAATGRHGPNVMPVRVQVRNPFDYDNPAHMKAVREEAKKRFPGNTGLQYELDAIAGVDDTGGIYSNWSSVEHPDVQRLIKELGHDAYYSSEAGVKNLGIYDPKRIKSDIGNRGTYDINKADINEAHGGAVHMAGGGFLKRITKDVIGKAAESAGMKAPVTAAKDLTTLQDFGTSLGDRIRERAAETQNMVESMPFKYDKGQRVFTEGSSKKNMAPYTILERTPHGNQVVREDGSFKARKDPETGKTMRTPYEPGYKVRQQDGDDFFEFTIPESAIKGDVEMAGGGAAKKLAKEVIEGGVKGVKKLLGVADEVPKGVEPIVVRTPEERAVMEKWGQKQEQEAARQKKVEKAAKDSAGKSPEESAKPAKSKGPRVKSEADKYRKMAEEQGDEAVLKAVRAGEHLKPKPGGGYVGAPRTVTSPQGLGVMRKSMDKDFADSVEAVRLADPDRMGTWYDRAKQGIAESTEPYQLDRALEQHGVYSAGVSPESELTFALKHLNSRVAGEPGMAYRGAGMRNLDEAVAEGRPANMGFKIGEYSKKNDPRLPNTGLFGVDDFRRAQGMNYTDPQGRPWKAGVSETMHPFMDAETALQVDRANTAGIGGRTDWHGPHIQELPWVYGKGQDLHGRGLKGRYSGDELEGIKMALRDANNTARDYFYKHTGSATHEAIPGASTGHVPQMIDAPYAEKVQYGNTGRWDVPAPEYALSDMGTVGAGNRDAIYGALGYRQLPTIEASGAYFPEGSKIAEHQPVKIARPLLDFPTGGEGLIAEPTRHAMEFGERFRALNDAQEAFGFNLPNTMDSVKSKNSLVLDTRGSNPRKLDEPHTGVMPSDTQMGALSQALGDVGYGVAPTSRGATVFPFDSKATAKDARELMKTKGAELQSIYPSKMEPSLNSSGYGPGVGIYTPEGFKASEPFSGQATMALLKEASYLPPDVALNLGESESVRNAIRGKTQRDAALPGARADIQETRRFFSEADWPKAVALIRQGYTPAAALAALGYSASSMAEDRR